MTIELIAWASAVSALAAWLGYRAGHKRAHVRVAAAYWYLGVRSLDLETRTITFSDGTTHTERVPRKEVA